MLLFHFICFSHDIFCIAYGVILLLSGRFALFSDRHQELWSFTREFRCVSAGTCKFQIQLFEHGQYESIMPNILQNCDWYDSLTMSCSLKILPSLPSMIILSSATVLDRPSTSEDGLVTNSCCFTISIGNRSVSNIRVCRYARAGHVHSAQMHLVSPHWILSLMQGRRVGGHSRRAGLELASKGSVGTMLVCATCLDMNNARGR